MQSGFSRARAVNSEDAPLAYDDPVALHGVTSCTTRLLPDESVKAGVGVDTR